MSTVSVDDDLCIASETCVSRYPQAFRIGGHGTAEVLPAEAELSDDDRHAVIEACPAAALHLA
jgi:ferredoxin